MQSSGTNAGCCKSLPAWDVHMTLHKAETVNCMAGERHGGLGFNRPMI